MSNFTLGLSSMTKTLVQTGRASERKNRRFVFAILLPLSLVVWSSATSTTVQASSVPLPMGGALLNIKRKTLVDMRFKNVVRQRYDLSCGAAAIATLMQFFYGEKITEKDVIADISKFGDVAKIKKFGFSMLELKRFGDRRGFIVRGFKVKSAKDLVNLKIPVLTLINVRGYNHFVILKGIRNGQVYIADPAFGNRNYSISSFEAGWSKIILAYLSPKKSPKNQFALRPSLRAPVSHVRFVLESVLGTIRPGRNQF